jgi:hypothetical protein
MSKTELAVVDGERKELFKGIRNLKKRAFLAAFCRIGQIEKASRKAKVHWSSHYRWLETDPVYVQAFKRAWRIVADRLEGSLIDSALNGDEKVVTYEGEITNTYKQKSDIIRIFMLKGLKPQYRDTFNLNSVTGPTEIVFHHPPSMGGTVRYGPPPSSSGPIPAPLIDVTEDGSDTADD